MTPLKQAFGKYWLAYYLVYVVSVAAFLWLYRVPLLSRATPDETRLYLLAAVFGVSAGIALLVTILMEVLITLVLLAPRVWQHAVNQGRQEGRQEGRKEGRQEGLQEGLHEGRQEEKERVLAIIDQYGKRDPETGQLVISEEGLRLLNGSDGTL